MQRARLSGVDDPNIYYTEAVIHALRNEKEAALEKLLETYERGFRDHWWLAIDKRIDSLRNEPAFIALEHQIRDDVNLALLEVAAISGD